MSEKYKPSEEEIQKAEDMMTEEQKEMSIEEKIKTLESYANPLVHRRVKEMGLGFDYGFIGNKEEFLRLFKDAAPHSFDRKEIMDRISLLFHDDYKDDLKNLEDQKNKNAVAAKDVIRDILSDIDSIGLLKTILNTTRGELHKAVKDQLDRVVATPQGARGALEYFEHNYSSREYGGRKYDQDMIESLVKAVEKVDENNIPDWFIELAEKHPLLISPVYDYDDGINRDYADRKFKDAFDFKVRELTIDKERVLSDADLLRGGSKYKKVGKGSKILELTTEQIEEIRQQFQQHDEEVKIRREGGKFGPQKAEWINDNQVNILFKKGDKEAIVEVKVNRMDEDKENAWYEIYYPGGGFEVDINTRPVNEIIREIEEKFGVKIATKG